MADTTTRESGFVVGSLADDAIGEGRRGWVIGSFFDPSHTRHSPDLEVKYGRFRRGEDPNHPAKTSSTTEFTLILSGAVRAVIDSQELVLSQGDYVLIHPDTPNNTVLEVLYDATVLTVKGPSDPGAKRVLGPPPQSTEGTEVR